MIELVHEDRLHLLYLGFDLLLHLPKVFKLLTFLTCFVFLFAVSTFFGKRVDLLQY